MSEKGASGEGYGNPDMPGSNKRTGISNGHNDETENCSMNNSFRFCMVMIIYSLPTAYMTTP